MKDVEACNSATTHDHPPLQIIPARLTQLSFLFGQIAVRMPPLYNVLVTLRLRHLLKWIVRQSYDAFR